MIDFSARKMIPYIPPVDYDKVATEFLETYYPEALNNPTRVPIEDVARNGMGLDVQYMCITEEPISIAANVPYSLSLQTSWNTFVEYTSTEFPIHQLKKPRFPEA